jgi:hypothetical protein
MEDNMQQNNTRKLFSDIGFVFLSICGGILTGAIFGIIGSFIYLIILFPVIMGIIGGNIITGNVKYTKTRSAFLVTLASVLTVIALYATFHYMRYMGLWIAVTLQAFGDFSDKSLESGKVLLEYALKKETGYSGLIGYVLYKAQQGVSIGRLFRSNSLNLGPIFTWVYWLIEVGVIGFLTMNGSKQILKKRYCEHCNSWYTGNEHIGSVPFNKETEILNSIKQKDFASVGALLEKDTETPSFEFYLQNCSKSCEKGNSFLSVTLVNFLKGRLISKDISEITLKPIEKKLFIEKIKFLEN